MRVQDEGTGRWYRAGTLVVYLMLVVDASVPHTARHEEPEDDRAGERARRGRGRGGRRGRGRGTITSSGSEQEYNCSLNDLESAAKLSDRGRILCY